jgi:hypothetical protein
MVIYRDEVKFSAFDPHAKSAVVGIEPPRRCKGGFNQQKIAICVPHPCCQAEGRKCWVSSGTP